MLDSDKNGDDFHLEAEDNSAEDDGVYRSYKERLRIQSVNESYFPPRRPSTIDRLRDRLRYFRRRVIRWLEFI